MSFRNTTLQTIKIFSLKGAAELQRGGGGCAAQGLLAEVLAWRSAGALAAALRTLDLNIEKMQIYLASRLNR
jgi:hypothetical protein